MQTLPTKVVVAVFLLCARRDCLIHKSDRSIDRNLADRNFTDRHLTKRHALD